MSQFDVWQDEEGTWHVSASPDYARTLHMLIVYSRERSPSGRLRRPRWHAVNAENGFSMQTRPSLFEGVATDRAVQLALTYMRNYSVPRGKQS